MFALQFKSGGIELYMILIIAEDKEKIEIAKKEVKKEEIKTIKTKKEPAEHLSNEQVKVKLNKEIKEVEGTYTP